MAVTWEKDEQVCRYTVDSHATLGAQYRVYLTNTTGGALLSTCNCTAGSFGKNCKHQDQARHAHRGREARTHALQGNTPPPIRVTAGSEPITIVIEGRL